MTTFHNDYTIPSIVSNVNSTNLSLSSGQSFIGEYEHVDEYSSLSVFVVINTAGGESGTLNITMSPNGSDSITRSAIVNSTSNNIHTQTIVSKYVRISFDADQGTSATGVIQTIFHKYRVQGQTSLIDDTISSQDDALLVRAVNVAIDGSGTYTNIKSTGLLFSTQTPLNNGIEFDSGVLDMRGFNQVQTHILASHDGSISFIFHQASDGSNIVRTITVPYTAADGFKLFSAPCFSDYVQYKFLNNSGSNQTSFHFETKLLTTALQPQILDLESFISPAMTSTLQRSVITAKNPLGNYVNVESDNDNKLKISNGIDAPQGESINVTYGTVFQTSHLYGIPVNSQMHITFIDSGGTITSTSDGTGIDISTDTSVGSFAVIRSKRVVKYRYGLANIVKIAAIFDTGVANSLQFTGIGNSSSDLYFCMNGTEFGVRRSYGGLLEVRELQITSAATGTETATITLNGTAYTVALSNAGGDISFTANEVEKGGSAVSTTLNGALSSSATTITVVSTTGFDTPTGTILINNEEVTYTGTTATTFTGCTRGANNTTATSHANGDIVRRIYRYSGWDIEHIDDKVFFIGDAVGARNGTYSFSSATAAGTFTQVKGGAALTTEFVAQADWNGSSPMVTRLDPVSYKNMYEIGYTWYGVGNINFRVYNPEFGRYETVHTMTFANSTTSPSLTAPNMYLQQGVASLGSTTALTLSSTGSFAATLGDYNPERLNKSSASNEQSIAAGTEEVVLAISNRLQINGYPNQSEILIEDIYFAVDGNRAVTFKMIKNPTTLSADTTTDFTDFQYVNEADNLLLVDTTANTYTGGTELLSFVVPKNNGISVDLSQRQVFLSRDDVIIFTAESSAVNTVNISVGCLIDIN